MSKENKETNLRTLDQKEMGRRVRNRREAKNLSREELAESLGVSPQFVADIEYGNKGVNIISYNNGEEETTYIFMYEDVLVTMNMPKMISKEEVKNMIEKAV